MHVNAFSFQVEVGGKNWYRCSRARDTGWLEHR